MEKYNHKKALEGLGLSEADFKCNIPTSYTGRSNVSRKLTKIASILSGDGVSCNNFHL